MDKVNIFEVCMDLDVNNFGGIRVLPRDYEELRDKVIDSLVFTITS